MEIAAEDDEVEGLAGVEKGVGAPNVKALAGVAEEDEGVEVEAPKLNPVDEEGAGAEEEEGVEGVKENPEVTAFGSSFFSSVVDCDSSSFFFPSSSFPPFAIEPKVAPNENPLLGFEVDSSVFPFVAVEVDVEAGEVGGETL